MLLINSVYKQSGDFALTIDSLTLPDQGLIFLVGHNGSGKSTLLRILSGRDLSFEGKLCYDGQCLNSKKLANYADNVVAYCPSDNLIFPNKSAMDNVLAPFAKKDKAKAREILISLGLGDSLNQKANTFSSGEQRRLSVGRVLYSDKPVLILDEPVASVDDENGRIVMNCLFKEAKDRLVIISTNEGIPESVASNPLCGLIQIANGQIINVNLPKAMSSGNKVSSPIKERFLGTRMKEIFRARPVAFVFLFLASFLLSGISILSGCVSTSYLGSNFPFEQAEFPMSYEDLAYAANADIFTSGDFSWTAEEPTGDPVPVVGSALSVKEDEDFPYLATTPNGYDYLGLPEKEFLAGGLPDEKEIAISSGFAKSLFPGFDVNNVVGEKVEMYFPGVPDYGLRVSGVFNGDFNEEIESAYSAFREKRISIAHSNSLLCYFADYFLCIVNDLNDASGFIVDHFVCYPANEINRLILSKDYHSPSSWFLSFSLDKDQFIQCPIRTSSFEFYVSLSFCFVCVLSIGLGYLTSNREQVLLLRFAGMERRRISIPMAFCVAFTILTGFLLGLPLGIGALYWLQASFFAQLSYAPVNLIHFGAWPFAFTLLCSLLVLGLLAAAAYPLLFNKNLSREVRKINEFSI